jgi:hypothetical protein
MKYSELEAKYFEKEKERQHLTFQGYRHEINIFSIYCLEIHFYFFIFSESYTRLLYLESAR